MVGDDLTGPLEPERGESREHSALVRNRRGMNDVVGGNTVRGDEQQGLRVGFIDLPDLAGSDE